MQPIARRGKVLRLLLLLLLLLLRYALMSAKLWHVVCVGSRKNSHKVIVRVLAEIRIFCRASLLHGSCIDLEMRSGQTNLLHGEIEVASLDFCIMISNELLNDLVASSLKLLKGLWHHFLYLLQEIHPYVLIAVRLEYITSNLATFEALRVDKVTKLTTCAAVGAMVVAARHSSEVAWLDDLIHVDYSLLLGRHLIDLGHLRLSLFINLLILGDGFVGELYQYIRWLTCVLGKEAVDTILLLYKKGHNDG